jgi:hypothetical protein
MSARRAPSVGDRVRIERDEVCYPSKGTWPQFRGCTGTVVEVNRDRRRPHLSEWGVVFGQVSERKDRPGAFAYGGNSVVWFKPYELTICTASGCQAEGIGAAPAVEDTRTAPESSKTAQVGGDLGPSHEPSSTTGQQHLQDS